MDLMAGLKSRVRSAGNPGSRTVGVAMTSQPPNPGGVWTPPGGEPEVLRILRPSDGTLVGELAVTPAHEVPRRVARTRSVQAGWASLPPKIGNDACGASWMPWRSGPGRSRTPSWPRRESPGWRPPWRWSRWWTISGTT